MKTLIAVSLSTAFALTAGCATTGTGIADRDGTAAGGSLTLDAEADQADNAARSFPARLDKVELRAAERLTHRIVAAHAGTVSTQIKLCVTPAGAVDSVDMIASSGLAEYDAIVLDAAADWRYESFAAPDHLRLCEKLTVAYKAP